MSANDNHIRVTYQEIHTLIGNSAAKIKKEFQPELMIAIGIGFFPARVMRTFLKTPGQKNIPIQAIGLSLYEELGTLDSGDVTSAEKIGKEVIRTQWLDFSTLGSRPLLGRKILIVDEVDDSRTTLLYAISELLKDVEKQAVTLNATQEMRDRTEFGIFVVHNKLKPKAGELPEGVRYFSGEDIPDEWVDYPWEQQDITTHDALAAEARKAKKVKTE
ncbi:PRTase-like protein [Atractiella rhizophila]|nr:PRTase-like protein [Atractiella rhizophila]